MWETKHAGPEILGFGALFYHVRVRAGLSKERKTAVPVLFVVVGI